MQKLTFINSHGHEIVFDDMPPYIFWKIDGLAIQGVDSISTQAAGQHGYTLHSTLLGTRNIQITGHIHGTEGILHMYEMRKKLNGICNPLLGLGSLVYENDSGKWRIAAFCESITYPSKIQTVTTVSVSFEAPSPFWLEWEPTEIALAFIDGGLMFPLETPNHLGVLGYRAAFYNDSDFNVPLEVYIGGGAINPTITNMTTGEFICVEKQMNYGDSLYINTDPERMEISYITINPATNTPKKENAYGYITDDSDMMTLAPGMNELIFKTDDENKKIRIKLIFNKRFIGV